MLRDRDYMRPSFRGRIWSATIVLLIVNLAVFLLQFTLLPYFINPAYLALSLEGLRLGFVWQLLTYQFMHSGLLHLFVNCWALYMFGREVEWQLGKTRFVLLYLLGGVVGGLFQMLVSFLWPHYFGGPVVGASAGVAGIVAAFAMLYPERRLTLLLFFVIPINMRAKSLLWATLVITALGIAFPRTLGGNIAHAAHLGGILTGLAFSRLHLPRWSGA